ncbi:MAG: hypothetical protein ACFUZC_06795 [Chthoniobacteraceae bacterium]
MKRLLCSLLCAASIAPGLAQVPDAAVPSGAAAPAQPAPPAPATSFLPGPARTPKPDGSFLGKDLPMLNPGNEILSWDGKNWNINNQRLFLSRFEKYLNAPEETDEINLKYQTLLRTILTRLAPANDSRTATLDAWRLLPQASNYTVDAHLCDALADAVYSAWLAMRAQDRLVAANQELDNQRKQFEWAAQHSGDSTVFHSSTKSKSDKSEKEKDKADQALAPYVQRLAEVNARLLANTTKREISAVQAKIEFQSLIMQFFLQRRFQHVLIATRFYRHLFSDGESTIGKTAQDGKGTQKTSDKDKGMPELYMKETGMPLTVGVVDSMANEAIRDVHEGVDAYQFLLSKGELESATKRLGESFLVGEYLPEIRTLPRDQKRQALEFTQKGNRLISSLDVRDFAQAEQLVGDLEKMAKDFDASQPRAAIETARTVSAMHLAKAKNAAVSGDRATLESELREATTIWPRNPALAEVSGMIFSHADVQQKAIADLEQLLAQRNYRQIFDDKMRFIAAVALYPDRQEQLKKVIENMTQIETAIGRSTELAKMGNPAGAWEGLERAYAQFPDDTKLNQLRANYTSEAADFVRCIRTAQQLEAKGQTGSSLSWYLKAQKQYPPSEYASEGVGRLVKKILPQAQ